jgi:DNA-3-methyladenine glycosylase
MRTRPDHRALTRLAPLPRAFYNRGPLTVARELLGKLLISSMQPEDGPHPQSFGKCGDSQGGPPTPLAGRIVETEAYLGAADPGAHAYRGRTARNAVLFGPPGHAYVYFIYGNHYCTNVSCQPEGEAGCVLLRALEPVCGIEEMAALRGVPLGAPSSPGLAELRRLTSGPGRLSQALGITRPRHNGCDLCSRQGGLYIAEGDAELAPRVVATPRINVTRAPHHEYRFLLSGNPFVSARRA